MTPLHRIAECAVQTAAQGRIVTQVGPFRACLDPSTDLIWVNYVVPVWALGTPAETFDQLQQLRQIFLENRRTLRVEFVDGIWPELPQALQRFGMTSQGSMRLMTCTPETFVPVMNPEVTVTTVAAEDGAARELFNTLQRSAFTIPGECTEDEDQQLKVQIESGFWLPVTATLRGEPAGSGILIPNGTAAELAGVGTSPHARRKGVASTVSSWLLQQHFAGEGDLVWLTALDEPAIAAYRKIGFVDAGVQWHYIDPQTTA